MKPLPLYLAVTLWTLGASLAAQEGVVGSAPLGVSPAQAAPLQVVPTPAPGSRAAALAALQAQGQVPAQAAEPAAGQTPPPAGESAVPTAKDVLAVAISRNGDAESRGAEAEAERDRKEINELRLAYKGPFILASDLFAGRGAFRRSTGGASVSDDYRLGTGDEMLLYVFGSATFEVPLVVDRSGKVTVPKVGTAHVAGLRLGDARTSLQRLVNTILAGSRVDLQFAKIRDVRVFILGEVYLPGSHVVPSLTSLLNALAVAGGPSAYGSYRSIQLIRDAKVVQTLDLYPLRLKGLGMENTMLRDGDTLFVPPAGTQVLMQGAFVRVATSPQAKGAPGVLVELKPGEQAWDAVQAIGGLLPTAYQGLVTLQRRDPQGVVNVENLAANPEALKVKPIFVGDVMTALARSDWREGLVEVAGYVKVPGTFAHRAGLRVADLMLEPMQIQPDTYMGRGQIIRTRDDGRTELYPFDLGKALQKDSAHNLALLPRDKVELYQVDSLRLKQTVRILGPFTKPGTYDWHDRMRAADLIFQAGVPQLQADRFYAELAHFAPDGQPGQVAKLDLQKLLFTEGHTAPALQDPAANPPLQPFDQITLYEIPDFKVHRTVTISGQVKRPGPYVITERHFTLSQLIERAGGFTEEAMPKGGIFLRSALRDKDLTEAELKKAGIKDLDPTGQGINDILQRLSETKRTKETGVLLPSPVLHGLMAGTATRLVVDFEAARKGDRRRDVELLDGDQVIIPRRAESAYVVGEVASPFSTFRVEQGDKVKDVIQMAGGFTRNADQAQVRLLKADGRVLDSWVDGKEVEPGDAVLVPQRFRVHTTWQDNLQALTPLALLINAVTR